jgi:uncharacterized protein YjhX (UPF0386 family)
VYSKDELRFRLALHAIAKGGMVDRQQIAKEALFCYDGHTWQDLTYDGYTHTFCKNCYLNKDVFTSRL